MARTDVQVVNHGTVFTFILLTEAAVAWVQENLEVEGWQWTGPHSFAVDYRFADSVAAMMQDHEEGPGLRVR